MTVRFYLICGNCGKGYSYERDGINPHAYNVRSITCRYCSSINEASFEDGVFTESILKVACN